MIYRILGSTGEKVSAIGVGGWHLGLSHVDEALSLVAGSGAHVDHWLKAGQRHQQQIGLFQRTVSRNYAFAGTIGHVDAAVRRRYPSVQDGCGRREER